ncbi:unnamed protein product [Agarophyton chilense]
MVVHEFWTVLVPTTEPGLLSRPTETGLHSARLLLFDYRRTIRQKPSTGEEAARQRIKVRLELYAVEIDMLTRKLLRNVLPDDALTALERSEQDS